MKVQVEDIKMPTYRGLESQYEHYVYHYLEETIGKRGYLVKIKKTEYLNVDMALSRGRSLSCDAYIFNNEDKKNPGNNLFGLFELESNEPTSKLADGIIQLQGYCEKLRSKYQSGEYTSANDGLLCVAYDGQQMCMWKYDLETGVVTNIIGSFDQSRGESVTELVRHKFINYFPEIDRKGEEGSEARTITEIKTHLRANKMLQANKSFLMTILAAIYGKKREEDFIVALEKLQMDKDDNEAEGILREWNNFVPKIEYDTNMNTQRAIREKLYGDAKRLWLLSQNRNMDLYGFIYEELVEEKNKQDEGEFYTSRHIIAPMVSAVTQKYVFPIWEEHGNITADIICTKRIVDPFCGSGGFLYEFLRFLKTHLQYSDDTINRIAGKSLNGFDKNDIMSAFLNMYLIGDGKSNLCQVTSSINWQNMWNYTVEGEMIQTRDLLEKNIINNKPTIKNMVNCMLDWKYVKRAFSIREDNYEQFCKMVMSNEGLSEDGLYYGLINYKKEPDCVLKWLYDMWLYYGNKKQEEYPSLEELMLNIGNTDLILTNIPYGPVDDIRLTTRGKGTLEALALKQCIDMLRPSSYRLARYNRATERWEEDANGERKSNNDGGIATIIVPNGILESENNRYIRDYLFSRCNVLAVIKLPSNSFAPYATIQTFVITIQKKCVFEYEGTQQDKNCFFYIVDGDGKANSKNRYPTRLLGKTMIETKDGSVEMHEYLHDELAVGVEAYPEGYMSRLERAWIYGIDENIRKWNQKRYTEKYTGTGWQTINDTEYKWCYAPLKKIKFEKRTKRESKAAKTLFEDCFNQIEGFEKLDIQEQKELAVRRLKGNLLKGIEKIWITYDASRKRVQIEPRVSNSLLIKSIVNEWDGGSEIGAVGAGVKKDISLESLKDYVEQLGLENFPRVYGQIVAFLEEIEEVEFSENDVTFYTTEEYQQYTMVPEYYLHKLDNFMSEDDILENVLRLRQTMRRN